MNPTENTDYNATGSLIVSVSTAGGALPLEGALVTVQGSTPENSGILSVLTTDQSGRTPRLSLPTPAKAESERPGNRQPYALYHIYVNLENYYPQSFLNVPVFASTTSIQPVALLPVSEYSGSGKPNEQSVTESQNPDL